MGETNQQSCFCDACSVSGCLMKNKIFKAIFKLLGKWISKKNAK